MSTFLILEIVAVIVGVSGLAAVMWLGHHIAGHIPDVELEPAVWEQSASELERAA